ncbi:MAG: hypothetical protein A4E38_01563 [Methanoregulaceae archaeon PtaB.Bin108]|jgi:hypothetical protein|nr:MAG: hypothetical protein A4E38_01563 [Methanoregulaceae archaeon PtaB.Bin108]OPY41317.1 MAG: hypothetical protein A4E42_01839 [Methanoregulaceae archaeon PtaU1.Bin222]
MYLKIHRTPAGDEVVAVCDRELMDTTITGDELEITIRESFYGTSLANPDEVRSVLSKAGNANLIGERTISLAVEMGLINRSSCLMLGKVPHAQFFRI